MTGPIRGLKYEAASKKVTANRPIVGNVAPILSFGEDRNGETYGLTVNGGIFRFASIAPAPAE